MTSIDAGLYEIGLGKNAANYVPLSPIGFLRRSAAVYPDRISVIHWGQVIARVGHTGDASAAGPHLHFAINQMAPGDRWWNGSPINPYPLLAGKRANG